MPTTRYYSNARLVASEDAILVGEKPVKGVERRAFQAGQVYAVTRVARHENHSSFGNVWDFTFDGLRFFNVALTTFALKEIVPDIAPTADNLREFGHEVDEETEVVIPMRSILIKAPRYVWHQPPRNLQGRDGLREGLRAYELRGLEREALLPELPYPENAVVWLSRGPTYGPGSYKVDLARVDRNRVRITGQAEGHLLHQGDIAPEAVVEKI